MNLPLSKLFYIAQSSLQLFDFTPLSFILHFDES